MAFSSLDCLGYALALFIMIFVSWPVKTQTPITHSVFRSELPLKSIWSGSIGATVPSLSVTVPSNLYKNSLGVSHSIVAPSSLSLKFDSVTSSSSIALSTYLCLRFVSPSRFFVSMKHKPFLSELFRMYISHGKNSSSLILTSIPT